MSRRAWVALAIVCVSLTTARGEAQEVTGEPPQTFGDGPAAARTKTTSSQRSSAPTHGEGAWPFFIQGRGATPRLMAPFVVSAAVNGTHAATSGVGVGVYGSSSSPLGSGGYFWNTDPGGRALVAATSTGVDAFEVLANGNVGIGTTSPTARLHIANASSSGTGLFVEASEGDRAAMYYSPNTGMVLDSFRPADARRLPVLLQPNGGDVGIGTASPGKLLHLSTPTNSGHLAIGGANQNALMFVNAANSTTDGFLVGRSYSSDNANTFFIYDLTANTNRFLIDAGGRVGIGTNAPSSKLSVDGDVGVTGTVCAANISCASDARLKQDVRPLSYGLPEVLRLRPVSWQWNDPTTTQLNLGLVAQEVAPVLPELILRSVDAQGSLGLNYMGLFPVLIRAIQEQQDTVATLTIENATLSQQNASMSARLTALEQALQHIAGQPRVEAHPIERQQ